MLEVEMNIGSMMKTKCSTIYPDWFLNSHLKVACKKILQSEETFRTISVYFPANLELMDDLVLFAFTVWIA